MATHTFDSQCLEHSRPSSLVPPLCGHAALSDPICALLKSRSQRSPASQTTTRFGLHRHRGMGWCVHMTPLCRHCSNSTVPTASGVHEHPSVHCSNVNNLVKLECMRREHIFTYGNPRWGAVHVCVCVCVCVCVHVCTPRPH